jgi:2-octaprenyl-6-methoxyphenol hydroxylase
MNSSLQHDVVIAGAGMVGASLAYALARKDFDVAVIEPTAPVARRQEGFDERSITLSFGSARIFQALGLWSDVAAHATPIRTIQITEARRFGSARLDARDEGVDALGYVVNARAFTNVLNDAVATLPNVRVYCPARVTALAKGSLGGAKEASHLVGESSHLPVVLSEGDMTSTVATRLLVGADGADSTVRKLLGIAASERDYGQVALVTNVDAEFSEEGAAFERFTTYGPIALLPNGGRRYGVVWMVESAVGAELMALSDAAFAARLRAEFAGRLGAFSRVGQRFRYPLKLTRTPQPAHMRAVLIGNAANALHPIGAQGFNLGLRDVAMLAQLLVDARRADGDIGADDLLRRYAQSRAADQRRTVLFTDVLARVFDAAWFAPLRPLGLLATQLVPPLRHRIARGAMGLGGSLTRLARGLPL